ncbi:hypothetical protein EC973_006030 [Apophysomyces ossiformis]|uniref:FAD dependent oxidoreductase domain-containing protein n=1 Tax=Apophysomyces ossiformis TaxID=679940 RepID=A0A8H7BVN4_9FUNG|nr:hypothetical protein EC973_006030 [Apophysomyces ossiformis]
MSIHSSLKEGSKIVIVGGGCFGLSTAYALSLKNKYDIWVFDRHSIPSADAASTGKDWNTFQFAILILNKDINKIVRMDYADDVLYMNLMMEAFPHWHEWNKERAQLGLEPVFHQTGVLMLSTDGRLSDFESKSMQNIREAGYGHAIEELKKPEDIIKRYPYLEHAVSKGYNIGYLNKEGGWCNSAEAVKHLYHKCLQNGVKFVVGNQGCFRKLYCDPKNRRRVLGIQTADDQIHRADRVILATGSWTAGLIDTSNQLLATGQFVVQFQAPESMKPRLKGQPVWCADISRTGFYGFPPNAEGKIKIARHFSGYVWPREGDNVSVPRTQVTHPSDTIPSEALSEARTFLADFMPQVNSLDIAHAKLCWYSDSIDGSFLVDYHPEYENLIVASGDSGHGMKFIPVIGFKICHVLEGIDSDYSRAWRWRAGEAENARFDALRANAKLERAIITDTANAKTSMASPRDLLAIRSHL